MSARADGNSADAPGRYWWNTQTKVNGTQVNKQMGHPVDSPINHGPPYISHSSAVAQETKTLLLLGDSDGPAPSSGGLGVLTAHSDAPVVTKAAMRANLLQALEILSELVVQEVGHHLTGLA